jgi:hypothetical protein
VSPSADGLLAITKRDGSATLVLLQNQCKSLRKNHKKHEKPIDKSLVMCEYIYEYTYEYKLVVI